MYGIPNTNPDPQHHIQLQFFFFKKRCDTLSVDEPVDKLILCPTQKLAHQNSVIPFLLINRSAPSWQINFVSCTVYTPKKKHVPYLFCWWAAPPPWQRSRCPRHSWWWPRRRAAWYAAGSAGSGPSSPPPSLGFDSAPGSPAGSKNKAPFARFNNSSVISTQRYGTRFELPKTKLHLKLIKRLNKLGWF